MSPILLVSIGAVVIVCAFHSAEAEADARLTVPETLPVNNVPARNVQQAASTGSTIEAPNLLVPPSHREFVLDIWRRSATFRQQCSRIIDTPNVLVRVHLFAGIRW